MASTNNKNTLGNYSLETKQNNASSNYWLNNEYKQQPVNLAGFGFIQGHLPQSTLSTNAVDIESFLFGINSTNLIKKPDTVFFTPQLKTLNTESVCCQPEHKVILPESFEPLRNQRPF